MSRAPRRWSWLGGAAAVAAAVVAFAGAGCGGNEDPRSDALRTGLGTLTAPRSSEGWIEDSGSDECFTESSGDEIPPFARQSTTGSFDAASFLRAVEAEVDDAEPFDAPAGADGRRWTVDSAEGPITVSLVVADDVAQLTATGPDEWC